MARHEDSMLGLSERLKICLLLPSNSERRNSQFAREHSRPLEIFYGASAPSDGAYPSSPTSYAL